MSMFLGYLRKRVTMMTKIEMLTPHQIADILQISYDSALAFVRYSGIDYIKIGRQYRVSSEKLEAFLKQKGKITIDLEA